MKQLIKYEDYFRGKQAKRFQHVFMPYQVMTCKLDITRLVKLKKKHKLNAMLCYCVQKAAQQTENCHYAYVDEEYVAYYDYVYANWVIPSKSGELVFVGVPYTERYLDFEHKYIENNSYCHENNDSIEIADQLLMATSAVVNVEMESYHPGHSEDFCDNFLVWGKYTKRGFRSYLNVSFKFHHGLFDAMDAGVFFNNLQDEIYKIKIE